MELVGSAVADATAARDPAELRLRHPAGDSGKKVRVHRAALSAGFVALLHVRSHREFRCLSEFGCRCLPRPLCCHRGELRRNRGSEAGRPPEARTPDTARPYMRSHIGRSPRQRYGTPRRGAARSRIVSARFGRASIAGRTDGGAPAHLVSKPMGFSCCFCEWKIGHRLAVRRARAAPTRRDRTQPGRRNLARTVRTLPDGALGPVNLSGRTVFARRNPPLLARLAAGDSIRRDSLEPVVVTGVRIVRPCISGRIQARSARRPTARKRSIMALTWSATSMVLKWPASIVLAVTSCGQSCLSRSRSRAMSTSGTSAEI
jgi:hypothetical protein